MARVRDQEMKVVILAGGLGTRISEESHLKPKPMITIGEQPILWHIMKYYSSFGFQDFVICCGYKSHCIKEYFADYYLYRSDVTFDFSAENRMTVHNNVAEPWRVTLVDTGLYAQTGAREKKKKKYIGDEPFMLTYGDGVSDVDLNALLLQHEESGKTVTLTGIQPGGRFGVLDLGPSGTDIIGFREKAMERTPMERLAADGKLGMYRHEGFWQCMDTQRDRGALEYLWGNQKAPWKRWEDE